MPFFDDAQISLRHKERIKRLEGEKAENLSLAQRLTMRALKRTLSIPLPTKEGEVPETITFYVPAGDEWVRMNAILVESVKCNLETPEGQARMNEIQDELYTTLADLAVDDSLTKEFWADPKAWGADEVVSLWAIRRLFEAVKKLAEDGSSFRSK